jgi:hypothetical protein
VDPPGQSGVPVASRRPTLQYATAQQKSLPSSNRTGVQISSRDRANWMSKAMLSQDKPRISGCEENFHPRLFLCSLCRQQVLICRRCDRGQVYCGHVCALEVRRGRQREARRRYQASERGRRMHADRSRQYRARGRRVTDQGRKLATKPAQQPQLSHAAAMAAQPVIINAGVRVNVCYRCGQSVSNLVRMAPIRRSRRHPINPHTGNRHADISK